MAVWALAQLLDGEGFEAERTRRVADESDPDVRAEWDAGQT
jgi:hypothetical protein